jgi:hypothetical protein
MGDVEFRLIVDVDQLHAVQSTAKSFVLGKSQSMVEDSLALSKQRTVAHSFEMGIFKGGSVALNHLVFQPQKIVAIDNSAEPALSLEEFIQARRCASAIKPYYGVNQGDRRAMEAILAQEFPKQDIDLIIDDASHFYEETREAFNISFPYLKAGGLYVIEDWAWAHWAGDFWQKDNPYFGNKRALSNLLIELFMLAATRPDLIEDILVNHVSITVRRGPGILPPGGFEISGHYLLRGHHFEANL